MYEQEKETTEERGREIGRKGEGENKEREIQIHREKAGGID